jgi:hypothetical protein
VADLAVVGAVLGYAVGMCRTARGARPELAA